MRLGVPSDRREVSNHRFGILDNDWTPPGGLATNGPLSY